MPIYEIACKECGNQYERIVSFSSTDLPACPACSSVDVTRLLSQPAIHFKGSGWYITDSKKEDEKKKKTAAQKTESNGSAPDMSEESEPKGESKSETKAEAKSSAKSEKSGATEKG